MMATKLAFDPITAVFEINGWAVAHTTYPYRSRYAIAVKDQVGALEVVEGGDNEPLGMLLARFDPDLLEDYRRAIQADAEIEAEAVSNGEVPSPSHAARMLWLDRVRDETESIAGLTPAPYAEGQRAFA